MVFAPGGPVLPPFRPHHRLDREIEMHDPVPIRAHCLRIHPQSERGGVHRSGRDPLARQALRQGSLEGGRQAQLDMAQILGKRIHVLGSTLRSRDDAFKADLISDLGQQVWPLFAEGRLSPQLARTFPIEEAEAAFAELEGNQVSGKVVLVIDESLA